MNVFGTQQSNLTNSQILIFFELKVMIPDRNDKPEKQSAQKNNSPGEGLRSMRTTNVFRLINFELYAKPNVVIMGLGITCFATVLGYIMYMRYKYESQGYYAAIQKDGHDVYLKKKSKWDT